MSKKQKIALGVLAVLIVFCLWYTRPRSFEELFGIGEIKNYSMIVSAASTEDGKAVSENWIVEGREDRDNTGTVLKEILNSCKYRVTLRSLFPIPSHSTIYGEGSITANFGIIFDNESNISGIYRGQTATINFDQAIIVKAEDKDISKKLLEFAKTYGQLSSSSVKK